MKIKATIDIIAAKPDMYGNTEGVIKDSSGKVIGKFEV